MAGHNCTLLSDGFRSWIHNKIQRAGLGLATGQEAAGATWPPFHPLIQAALILHHPNPFQKQIFAFNIYRCVPSTRKSLQRLFLSLEIETFMSGGIGLILTRCCQGCSEYPVSPCSGEAAERESGARGGSARWRFAISARRAADVGS